MESTHGKAVFVTGCSSGIGRAIALNLSSSGFTVFATVRREKDWVDLLSLGNSRLIPVYPFDLTNAVHIGQGAAFVRRELESRGCKLYAVVNNAGGGGIAPLELADQDKLSIELETRIKAPVTILQSFLPLLRESGGRIVWIVTPALIPVPFVSSIHACDFAVNCIARTLQLELAPWKIPNIMIRCGGIRTDAPGRSSRELDESLRAWPEEKAGLYRNSLLRQQEELSGFDKKRTPPERVAEVVRGALMAAHPRRRYSVGHLSKAAAVLDWLPQALVDVIMAFRA